MGEARRRRYDEVLELYPGWQPAAQALAARRREDRRSERTQALDRESLQVVIPLLRAPSPDAVGRSDVDALVQALLCRGNRNRTVNLRVKTLRTLYTVLGGANPTHGVRQLREEIGVRMYLSRQERHRLLGAFDLTKWAGFRDFVMATLALDTGLRPFELCLLETGDLHLRAGASAADRTIHVRGVTSRPRRQTTAYVSREAAELVGEYLRRRAAVAVAATKRVWLTEKGSPVGYPCFYRALQRACRRAGVYSTPHLLRHSAARRWSLEQRMTPRQVTDMLRQKHQDGTLPRYQLLKPGDLVAVKRRATTRASDRAARHMCEEPRRRAERPATVAAFPEELAALKRAASPMAGFSL